MTDRELLTKIKEDYEKAYVDIGIIKRFNTALNYLYKHDMELGICFYSFKKYGIKLSYLPWIKKRQVYGVYWFTVPSYTIHIEQLRECISSRIQIMQEILDNNEC